MKTVDLSQKMKEVLLLVETFNRLAGNNCKIGFYEVSGILSF